jgi:hypothetical protein
MWAADVCSSLRRKAESLGFNDVVYVLRYRYSTGNLQLVIMPAKQEIVAEVKVLFSAVAGDYAALGFERCCTTTPAVVSITTRSGANIIRQSGRPKGRIAVDVDRTIRPIYVEQEGHVPLHLGSGRSALQPRPNATVRWRGIAGLHGFVVDWNFLPRTQA